MNQILKYTTKGYCLEDKATVLAPPANRSGGLAGAPSKGHWWCRVILVILLSPLGVAPGQAAETHGLPDPVQEMGAWFSESLAPFIQSGCLPSVPASSLTLAAFACQGYVRSTGQVLLYVKQTAQAVGPLNGGNGTYWLAVHQDKTTVVSSWTRQAGTHYLWRLSASALADPSGGLMVARITVAGGVVTAVADWRRPASYARAGVFDVIATARSVDVDRFAYCSYGLTR